MPRGRPKGSKNKPKTIVEQNETRIENDQSIDPDSFTGRIDPERWVGTDMNIPVELEVVRGPGLIDLGEKAVSNRDYMVFEMAVSATKAMIENGKGVPSETLADSVLAFSKRVVDGILA